jgi:hypothetical protein
MAIYKIQSGDNLSKIAQANGTTVDELLKANPSITDKNKIYAGSNLTIPDKQTIQQQSSANNQGSLEGTLGGQQNANNTVDKSLPVEATKTDNYGALKLALQKAAEVAKKSTVKTGMLGTMGKLSGQGIDTSKVSGDIAYRIADFVSGQTVKPIETALTNVKDVVDSIQTQSKQLKDDSRLQITQSISNGMWNKMTDEQRSTLWSAAGYTGNPIMAKDENVEYYQSTDSAGNVWNVGYNKSDGSIISKTNLGQIGKGTSDTDTKKTEPARIISDLLNKITVNGKASPSDYNAAKNKWTTYYNLDAKDFDEKFAQYVDSAQTGYSLTFN